MLSIESIGTRCSTWRGPTTGASPMRCVGLSGVISSGCCGLELLQPLHQPVVLEVADLRRRLDVVLAVVVANLLAQRFDALGNMHGHGQEPHSGATVTCFPRAELGTRQRNLSGASPVFRN